MKLLFATLVLSLAASLPAPAQVLLQWNFDGVSSPATMNSTTNAAEANASVLSRGIGAPASVASNSFRTQGFGNDGISLSNTDYFEFTLTSALVNPTMSLSSIEMRFNGTTTYAATPGVTMAWAYSFDSSSFTLLDTFVQVGAGAGSFDLSSVPALQNISGVSSITFRFYASGQTSTGGWGFSNTSTQSPGLTLNGVIVPEPTTYGLIIIAIALFAISLLRRHYSNIARSR
jgi:hypothetical protein